MDSANKSNSTYIYDYCEGYVIDAETGEVVDRIFDYSPPAHSTDHNTERPLNYNNNRLVHPALRGYYKNRRLYAKARRLEERGFVVDYSRLFDVGFKRSVLHEKSVKAEIFFNHAGLLAELEGIIREISERAPYLLARSRRGQLALAYVIKKMREGEKPRYRELRGIVSENAFRRALRAAEKLLLLEMRS